MYAARLAKPSCPAPNPNRRSSRRLKSRSRRLVIEIPEPVVVEEPAPGLRRGSRCPSPNPGRTSWSKRSLNRAATTACSRGLLRNHQSRPPPQSRRRSVTAIRQKLPLAWQTESTRTDARRGSRRSPGCAWQTSGPDAVAILNGQPSWSRSRWWSRRGNRVLVSSGSGGPSGTSEPATPAAPKVQSAFRRTGHHHRRRSSCGNSAEPRAKAVQDHRRSHGSRRSRTLTRPLTTLRMPSRFAPSMV